MDVVPFNLVLFFALVGSAVCVVAPAWLLVACGDRAVARRARIAAARRRAEQVQRNLKFPDLAVPLDGGGAP